MPTFLRSLCLPIALASALAVGGCSTGGHAASLDDRAASVPTYDAELGSLGYTRAWRGFPIKANSAAIDFVDAGPRFVAVQDSDNVLSVLDTTSGERLWSAEITNPLTRFVGMVHAGSRALVSSETELFIYDLETGTLLEKQRLDRVVNTKPLMFEDLLIYGTNTGTVLARLTSVNVRLWENSLNGPIDFAPIPVGSGFCVVSQSGEILVADPATGSGVGRARIFGGLGGKPVANDERIFLASLDHSVYAFSAEARQLWRHRTGAPVVSQPAIHDGVLYCAIEDGLTAFDERSGDVLWTNPALSGDVIGMLRGELLVWDGSNLGTVDPGSGEQVDSVRLDGFDTLAVDRFIDPNLYGVSNIGVVAKYTPNL